MADFYSNFEDYGDLGLHGVLLPEFKISKEQYKRFGAKEGISNLEFLKALVFAGYKRKKINELDNKQEYIDRAKKEIDILDELGFVDYILLIWDILDYCHKNEIPVGPGRGSAAGSLVCYFTGITDVDPIAGELYFERFISKTRAKPKNVIDGVKYFDGGLLPDIDSDICFYERHKVIEYIENKFKNKTCKILTISTLSGKLVIKESVKAALALSEDKANLLSGYIGKVFGKVEELDKAREESKELKEWTEESKEKYSFLSNEQVFNIAMKLEDLPKNFGVHASAMLITHDKLENICPAQLTKDGELISGYDKKWCEEIALKADVLGLRTLSVLNEICKNVGIKLDDIDVHDPNIYKFLKDLKHPYGLFQIKDNLNYKTVLDVQPDNLHELSDIIALARPGAMAYIPEYVEVKFGKKKIQQRHEALDKILSTTRGVCLYQEQMMKIAHDVFGFTLDEAEILRRVVGKKKIKEMEQWKPKVYEKAKENGLSEEIADMYWKILDDSKNYSFNRSHSISYAIIAAKSAYLKCYYPKEFFLAWLNMSSNMQKPHEEISKISKELKEFGINLLRPDLLKSKHLFTLDGNNIRYGLSCIKNVNKKDREILENFQGDYNNKFELFQAAKDSGLNIGGLSSLIQAGALDSTEENRCRLVLEAQVFNKLTDREKKYVLKLGEEFNYDLFNMIKALVESGRKDEGGKKAIFPKSRYETIKRNCEGYLDIYKKNLKNADLANWFFENKLLGYNFSSSLFSILRNKIDDLMPLSEFEVLSPKMKATFSGIVVDYKNKKTKSKENMLELFIEDESTLLKCLFYGAAYDSWCERNTDDNGKVKLPKKEGLVVVTGNRSNDVLFIKKLSIVDEEVYLKLSDLK